jgi:hypothetical protein
MTATVLEARAVITGEDRTAGMFAALEAKISHLSKAAAGVTKTSALVSRNASRVAEAQAAIAKSPVPDVQKHNALKNGAVYAGNRMMGIGAGYLGPLAAGLGIHEVVKAAASRAHERVRAQVSGMSEGEVTAAEMEAARLAKEFPSISQTEALHMLRNARAVVGTYKEAAEIMEPLMKLRIVAQGARPGADVSDDFDQLVKGLEIRGATQDLGEFRHMINGIGKAMAVFGDTLRPYQYYEMFKYGRQATPGLSDDFILSVAPTLAQELGGSGFGNAVSGFNRAIVGNRMEHGAIKEFVRLGLLAREDVDWLKSGEAKAIKPGRHIKGWETAQKDPLAWVLGYLTPSYDRLNLNDAERKAEASVLFSNRVAAQMVSMLSTQVSKLEKDRKLINEAPGVDEAARRFQSDDPKIAWQGLTHAIETLAGTLGDQFSSALTPATNALAKGITEFNAAVTRHAKDPYYVSPEQQRFNKLADDIAQNGPLGAPANIDDPRIASEIDAKIKNAFEEAGDLDDLADKRAELDRREREEGKPKEHANWLSRTFHEDDRDRYERETAELRAEVERREAARREHDQLLDQSFRSQPVVPQEQRQFPTAEVPLPPRRPAELEAAGAAPQQQRGPDLLNLLNGKIQADVTGKVGVEGQATVNVNVNVNATSELISAAASAKSAAMQLHSSASGGGSDKGVSMPEASPNGKQGLAE